MPLSDVYRQMARDVAPRVLECAPEERDAYSWHLRIRAADCPEHLRNALLKARESEMRWHLRFDDAFPLSPPRVRVQSPKFERGTAHVLEGGALCAHLLTESGWSSSGEGGLGVAVEALIALMDDGAPSVTRKRTLYDEETARDGFERAKRQHGWA